MLSALRLVAPGRPLREGLDRILQAKMGALIVIGDGPDVLSLCSGGFLLDAEFTPHGAFGITMRVFRAGGLTKDLCYLRGLVDLLDYLQAGHSLDVLWLGKMPLMAVPLVDELLDRGVLVQPLLTPRYLDDPSATTRLCAIDRVETILDLIEG